MGGEPTRGVGLSQAITGLFGVDTLEPAQAPFAPSPRDAARASFLETRYVMTANVTRPRSRGRSRVPALAAVLAMGVVGAAACGDDPFKIDWEVSPDTVLLYSLTVPELNRSSGFDFHNEVPVVLEQPGATGNWDMALTSDGSQFQLLPPGAMGISSKARVAPLTGVTFFELTEAPSDTSLYVSAQAVPVQAGTVYVWRTRQLRGAFGSVCVYYAKMEALEMDPDAGTLRFRYDSSPVCNDRSLIPR